MRAEGEGWVLHCGDCIEGMRGLANKSVDCSISDAPYDNHAHTAGRRGQSILTKPGAAEKRSVAARAAIARQRDLGFEPITQDQMAAASVQFARVTRRWVLVFCTFEMVGDPATRGGTGWRSHLERAGLDYVRTCVWHKPGSTPQFTGDRPAQGAEAIAWATQPDGWPEALLVTHQPGRKRWNGGGKHGHYSHPIVLDRGHNGARLHTTQKPLSLMIELVDDFTNEGETVLDAFAGSGTTGLAALARNRRFLGWELNRDYFEIACRRLRGEEAKPRPEQPSLF